MDENSIQKTFSATKNRLLLKTFSEVLISLFIFYSQVSSSTEHKHCGYILREKSETKDEHSVRMKE